MNALLDKDFLRQLDQQHSHTTYARLICLNIHGQPIEMIQGRVTGGSISLDGNSAIRRSCSLTLQAEKMIYHDYYWSLNTKIKIEIGVQNDINSKYDNIIWFPQGVFLITSFQTSNTTTGYTITIQGKDKMSLLNGELGGYIGIETDFGTTDVQQEDGTYVSEQVEIRHIIRDMIHSYGREPYSNILISDIAAYGLRQLEFEGWTNEVTGSDGINDYLYLIYDENEQCFTDTIIRRLSDLDSYYKSSDTNDESTEDDNNSLDAYTLISSNDFKFRDVIDLDVASNYTIVKKDGKLYSIAKIASGKCCGYSLQPLYYDGDLIAAATDTITSVLDKIVKMLGEFEYFYDLDGRFVFQAKTTYTQTTWNELIKTTNDKYISNLEAKNRLTYSFASPYLVSSYQNNPNINNIKNDYIVWGERNSAISTTKIPIHAHYAIDKKPLYYKAFDGTIYISNEEVNAEVVIDIDFEKSIPAWAEYFNPNSYANQTTYKDDPDMLAELEVQYKDICENWWDVLEWAEYYKKAMASIYADDPSNQDKIAYPNGQMSAYATAYTKIDLESIFKVTTGKSNYSWPSWETHPCFLFDIYVDGDYTNEITAPYGCLGFTGHNPWYSNVYKQYDTEDWYGLNNNTYSCGHPYSYFLDLYQTQSNGGHGQAFFYKPEIPKTVLGETTTLMDWREVIYQMAQDYLKHNHEDDFELTIAKNNPKYYPTGVTGYEQYYLDIASFWRTLYDPTSSATEDFKGDHAPWNENIYTNPSTLNFWFDFFNCENNDLEKFAVSTIGLRQKVVNDNTVKMITHEEIPQLIYVTEDEYKEAKENLNLMAGYIYVISTEIQENALMKQSTKGKTGQEMMDSLLYTYGQSNDTITINTVPIYYLNPNSLIFVYDNKSEISNIYVINKITIPLTYNSTMTINATKLPQEIS